MESSIKSETLPLNDNWNMYVHLHNNNDWSIDSYKKIGQITDVRNAILLNDEINYDLIKKSMIFIMKNESLPIWEDKTNIKGGCFSFKILNKYIEKIWKEMFFRIIGCTITENKMIHDNINGITLSPKKNFCILKIWMKTCEYQDPDVFVDIDGCSKQGCLFKKHS